MSRVTPTLYDLAQRLIAEEAKLRASVNLKAPVAFLLCERMRPHLANLMGAAGFRALLSRALALARAKVDWLRAAALTGDTIGVSEKVGEKVGQEVMAEGGTVLVSQLLALLVTFVGEPLTLQLVSEICPALSLNDLDPKDPS